MAFNFTKPILLQLSITATFPQVPLAVEELAVSVFRLHRYFSPNRYRRVAVEGLAVYPSERQSPDWRVFFFCPEPQWGGTRRVF